MMTRNGEGTHRYHKVSGHNARHDAKMKNFIPHSSYSCVPPTLHSGVTCISKLNMMDSLAFFFSTIFKKLIHFTVDLGS